MWQIEHLLGQVMTEAMKVPYVNPPNIVGAVAILFVLFGLSGKRAKK